MLDIASYERVQSTETLTALLLSCFGRQPAVCVSAADAARAGEHRYRPLRLQQSLLFVCLVQTLQELVNTGVQSEAPHRPQLVINPNWLTGAGTDSQEVWRALQSLGTALVLYMTFFWFWIGSIEFDCSACTAAAVVFVIARGKLLTGAADSWRLRGQGCAKEIGQFSP